MSNLSRFAAYAAAFEKSYESDDWTGVRPFFAEEAVYITGFEGGRFEGREAILEHFKADLDGFDRRFEPRVLEFIQGPIEEGPTVRFRGRLIYRAAGVPDHVLVLDEFVTFEGDLIVQIEDRFDDEMQEETEAYLKEHRDTLGFALD